MNILKIHRREGDKDANLTKDQIPTERALWVHWNITKNSLCFKISLQEAKLKRRSMLLTLSLLYDTLGLMLPFKLKGRTILQNL